jgi:hypothetical protein
VSRNEEPSGLGINGALPGGGVCVVELCLRSARSGELMCRHHWKEVPLDSRRTSGTSCSSGVPARSR